MKNNYARFLYVVIFLFAMMAMSDLFGQDYAIEKDGSKKFTGSKVVKFEEAVSNSTAIFVGRLLTSQAGAAASAGAMSYLCKVKTIRVLKGTVEPAVSIEVTVFDGWDEVRPKNGDGYVFFMEDPQHALKLLPASKKNIDAIVQIISGHSR